ncbi:hypothetical protein F5888DRAFT_1891481 [Russula emetica]|nr:hypothetical protein F5888DRAFT_1891481 [Russula emetica]
MFLGTLSAGSNDEWETASEGSIRYPTSLDGSGTLSEKYRRIRRQQMAKHLSMNPTASQSLAPARPKIFTKEKIRAIKIVAGVGILGAALVGIEFGMVLSRITRTIDGGSTVRDLSTRTFTIPQILDNHLQDCSGCSVGSSIGSKPVPNYILKTQPSMDIMDQDMLGTMNALPYAMAAHHLLSRQQRTCTIFLQILRYDVWEHTYEYQRAIRQPYEYRMYLITHKASSSLILVVIVIKREVTPRWTNSAVADICLAEIPSHTSSTSVNARHPEASLGTSSTRNGAFPSVFMEPKQLLYALRGFEELLEASCAAVKHQVFAARGGKKRAVHDDMLNCLEIMVQINFRAHSEGRAPANRVN